MRRVLLLSILVGAAPALAGAHDAALRIEAVRIGSVAFFGVPRRTCGAETVLEKGSFYQVRASGLVVAGSAKRLVH